MESVSSLFKGQAHYKVLQLLALRTQPLRLRALSELAEMYVRSIELALTQLIKNGVVTRTKKGNLISYSLNPLDPKTPLLREVFTLISNYENELRHDALDSKAKRVLDFSNSATALFQRAKR